ncbi:MAG TPA: hypothetical protein VKZ50_15195 [bacterium]|nr:hypothetical protein [bacterium]
MVIAFAPASADHVIGGRHSRSRATAPGGVDRDVENAIMHMHVVLSLRGLAAATVAACLIGGAAYADAAHEIVPGQRIGPVLLGEPLARAVAALGPYRSSAVLTETPVRLREYRWYTNTSHGSEVPAAASGFAVTCLPDNRITQVNVRYLPAYATPQNLHTSGPRGARGSSLLNVTLAMGQPGTLTAGQPGMRKMEYAGVRFWIDTDTQMAARIDIF